MATILVVEDEVPFNRLIVKNLSLLGHSCLAVYDGASAIETLHTHKLDLIILDVMLPELSGFDVIREVKGTPVIFVTAKAGLEDRLRGLSLGADDYIVKPFEMQELFLRVNAVLRRVGRNENEITFDDTVLDFAARRAIRAGKEIELTNKEFLLLETLIRNRNIVMSRDQLMRIVWDSDYFCDSRTVDVHIQSLRKKLGLKTRIKSIYKVGYRFDL